MSQLTQDRPCPLCGASDFKPVIEYNQFQYYTDQVNNKINLKHVNCLKCDTLYMNPAFTDEGFVRLFSKAAGSYGSTSSRAQEQIDWLSSTGLLKNSKKALDVGCYYGTFLSLLPGHIEKFGLEIDEGVVKEAQSKRPDIHFFTSTFDNIKLPEKVDLITMFHVLEHLVDPLSFLLQLKGQVDSQARLVIEIPIIENAITNDVCGFFNAQHTTHFSKISLKQILERTGWQILSEQTQKDYNGYRAVCAISNQSSDLQGWQKQANQFAARPHLLKYMSNWFSSVEKVQKEILSFHEKVQNSPFVIWGGGMHTEFLFHLTSLNELILNSKNCVIIDIDTSKQSEKWRGLNITSPEQFKNWSEAYFLPSSYFHHDKIRHFLMTEKAVKEDKILKLYDYIRVY